MKRTKFFKTQSKVDISFVHHLLQNLCSTLRMINKRIFMFADFFYQNHNPSFTIKLTSPQFVHFLVSTRTHF